MKIKCLECGRTIKAKTRKTERCAECNHQRRIQRNRKYNESHKEQHKQYYEKNKEKYNEYQREYRKRNKEKRKEYEREYRIRNIKKKWEYCERHKNRIREYHRQYNKTRRPFTHTHDRTTDLTIENGRVKGAVWLENQNCEKSVRKNFWRRSFFQKSYERALCSCATLQTPFYIAEKNHRTYCFECGGKIIIAFENDYYTITDVCCCFCGLVLPQTTP